jgi:hypothetical protein
LTFAGVVVTAAQAPPDTAISCTPATVSVGQSVVCETSYVSAQVYKWFAEGGSPDTGGNSGSFTTSFTDPSLSGQRTVVSFQACNGGACNQLTFAGVVVTAAGCSNGLISLGSMDLRAGQQPNPTCGPPTINSLGCPGSVTAGQSFTCTPSITGTVTSYAWNTFGDATAVQGTDKTFTGSFSSGAGRDAGTQGVSLTVCNTPAYCSSGDAIVGVDAAGAPQMSSLGCPGSAAVGQPFTCTPSISGTVTTYTWTESAGGNTGTLSSFSATLSSTPSGGSTTVSLTACNTTSSCSSSQASVAVGAAGAPQIGGGTKTGAHGSARRACLGCRRRASAAALRREDRSGSGPFRRFSRETVGVSGAIAPGMNELGEPVEPGAG